MYKLLITAAQLQQLQTQGKPCAVLDCSFDLMNPDLADGFFASERIAGALPAHLNKNLSTATASCPSHLSIHHKRPQ